MCYVLIFVKQSEVNVMASKKPATRARNGTPICHLLQLRWKNA